MQLKNKEVIRVSFTKKERKALDVFKFLNKELGNKNYSFDLKTLKLFFKFFKTKDLQILDSLWNKNFLQKDVFIFSLEFSKYFEDDTNLDKEYFLSFIELQLPLSPIKNFLESFVENIFSSFQNILVEKTFDSKNILYQDENFEIYYLKNKSEIFRKGELCCGNLFFYILLDGLILFENESLNEQQLLFTKIPPCSINFKLLTPTYSQLILIIKEAYLEYNELNLPDIDYGIYPLYNPKVLKNILNRDTLKSYFSILQLINYLVERVKKTSLELPDIEYIKYINYKREILNFFSDESVLAKENITQLLQEKLDVSIANLYKIFDILFQTTPHKYVENLKLEKSYALLEDGDKSITTVAEIIGYTYRIFLQKFTEKTGYTPHNFRNFIQE